MSKLSAGRSKLNGRSPEVRRRILLGGVLLSALVSSGRAFQVSVIQNEKWRADAYDQQGDTLQLAAPRGTIYDRDGLPLAASHEVLSVQIAPQEIVDTAAVTELLVRHLDMSERDVSRVITSKRKWIPLPGRYSANIRGALDNIAGIHFEGQIQRFYPNGAIALELLGPVRMDGTALGGLELEFDTVLNGRAGRAVVRKDSRGNALPGAMLRAIEPTPGRDVFLTLDYDLQEIAEQALEDALVRTNAEGGELLMTDPETGEVLAAVSRGRNGRARNWRAVTEPYEPGSTLKPFTVAALLSLGRAELTDSVYGEQGHYDRLKLNDTHPEGWMTLADALRKSSNIAIAKMGERLTHNEQYLAMRDFGFGSPTGVTYPSEAGGTLYRPARWSAYSPSRLSIGYEIAVTPLQMAMAYGALANGGRLLEPRVVREVRSRDGRIEKEFSPRMIRRVVTNEVAEELRGVLIDVVATGTGQAAALGSMAVAGKTGTAWIAVNGSYASREYIASFAGFFPAHDPQLVFVVKLDRPQGEYYGGLVAAPVTRATLEAALAARNSPIDRAAMAHATVLPEAQAPRSPLTSTSNTPHIVALAKAPAAARAAVTLSVPDVTGMPMRDGVHRLHSAGFRLRPEGSGRVQRTIPEAGAAVSSDGVIRVIGEGSL